MVASGQVDGRRFRGSRSSSKRTDFWDSDLAGFGDSVELRSPPLRRLTASPTLIALESVETAPPFISFSINQGRNRIGNRGPNNELGSNARYWLLLTICTTKFVQKESLMNTFWIALFYCCLNGSWHRERFERGGFMGECRCVFATYWRYPQGLQVQVLNFPIHPSLA